MKQVQLSEAAVSGAEAHRPGGIGFRHLLRGEEFAPDNYALMLVDIEHGYTAPRHRHNFEQVRVMLAGSFGFDSGQVQEAGSVGYFCEGTYYTQKGEGASTTLLLQVAGASGSSYMSARQLSVSIAALQSRGSFDDGLYTWQDDAGKTHHQDGYEAAWEHAFGRPVRYPKPRYDAPVLLRPERFGEVESAARPGVGIKRLGRFNERGLSIGQLRLSAGARHHAQASNRTMLLFCLEGRGEVDGVPCAFGTSVELRPGESAELSALDETRFFVFGLPRFDD